MKLKLWVAALLISAAVSAQESGGKGVIDFRYEKGVYKLMMEKYELSCGYGYQFNRFFYLGAGVGLAFPAGGNHLFVPLFADGRVYLLKGNISPFLSVRGGYEFCSEIGKNTPVPKGYQSGAFVEPSVGVRIKSFTLGVGCFFKKEGINKTYKSYGFGSFDRWDYKDAKYRAVTVRVGYEF